MQEYRSSIMSRMFIMLGVLFLLPAALFLQLVRINYIEGDGLRVAKAGRVAKLRVRLRVHASAPDVERADAKQQQVRGRAWEGQAPRRARRRCCCACVVAMLSVGPDVGREVDCYLSFM